jgi:hypothetical protein
VNSNQGLVLYYVASTRDEQIARESLGPAAVARREIMRTRHGRRQRRRGGGVVDGQRLRRWFGPSQSRRDLDRVASDGVATQGIGEAR